LFLGFEVTELPEPGKTNKFTQAEVYSAASKQNFVFLSIKISA